MMTLPAMKVTCLTPKTLMFPPLTLARFSDFSWMGMWGTNESFYLIEDWCDCSCINECCPRFLTFLRQWRTNVIDVIDEVDFHDVLFWNTWCEVIDSELVTTESLTLARGKDGGHRWWRWWFWVVRLIVRLLLMKRSEVLKFSELSWWHDCNWVICWLSCSVVRLPLMIWAWSRWAWFRSPPALTYWMIFETTVRAYLMTPSFSFSTLTLIPRPGLRPWPCGPLTFPFWLCLSFWRFWLPCSFLLILSLIWTLALWLPCWLLWVPLSLSAYLIHWILLGDHAGDVKLIDLLCVWGNAIVEVVDEEVVNLTPCWLLIDAGGKEHWQEVHEHFEVLRWSWCLRWSF